MIKLDFIGLYSIFLITIIVLGVVVYYLSNRR